ncbi:hypothetical protein AINA4_00620 [Aurantimicrobium sp. INA4]|nr:hypothetical protein AINA4_00620 [Aurantimicrobium sp. INA4]
MKCPGKGMLEFYCPGMQSGGEIIEDDGVYCSAGESSHHPGCSSAVRISLLA